MLGRVVAARDQADLTLRILRYRPGAEMRPHAHAALGATLVVSGSFLDRTEGQAAVCRALTLIVKPADAEHDTQVGPEGALSIHFEFSALGSGRLRELGVETSRCRYLLAGPATAELLGLLAAPEEGEPSRAIDVVARAIRGREQAGSSASSPSGDAHARSASRTTTRAAAEAAGMHPVAFARRFRRVVGVSPTQWRVQQRLSRAAGELAEGEHSAARIACAAGFADQSHLGRMFRRETGLSPGRYRELLRVFQREST